MRSYAASWRSASIRRSVLDRGDDEAHATTARLMIRRAL
jgi:hypothetical protein